MNQEQYKQLEAERQVDSFLEGLEEYIGAKMEARESSHITTHFRYMEIQKSFRARLINLIRGKS